MAPARATRGSSLRPASSVSSVRRACRPSPACPRPRTPSVLALVLASLLLLESARAQAPSGPPPAFSRVFAWGGNRYGELGLGAMANQESLPRPSQCSPQLLTSLSWESLPPEDLGRAPERFVGGMDHSAAIARDGSLYMWGRNREGQLGLGAEDEETKLDVGLSTGASPPPAPPPPTPPNAPPPPAEGLLASFDPRRIVVRDEENEPQTVVDVCLGQYSTAAVTERGHVYTWGSNRFGQLGLGTRSVVRSDKPRRVLGILRALTALNVTCGPAHVVVLTTEGVLVAWGANNEGQLGLGHDCQTEFGEGLDPCLQPRFEPNLLTESIEGTRLPPMRLVQACGHVGGGQVAPESTTTTAAPPLPPMPPPSVPAIVSDAPPPPPPKPPGYEFDPSDVNDTSTVFEYVDLDLNLGLESAFTVAVDSSNQLWVFGDNYYGQLGIGQEYVRIAHNTETYTRNRFDNVTGKYYNRQIKPTKLGMLGDGTIGEELQPDGSVAVKVTAFRIRSLTCGSHHVVALLDRGDIWTWGDNTHGQLGLGFETTDRETNTRVPTYKPRRVTHFDFYEAQTVSQLKDGELVSKVQRNLVTGFLKGPPRQRFIKVSAKKFQTVALSDAGSVYTWGTNSRGEQGTCGCGMCPVRLPKNFECPLAPPAPPIRGASAFAYPPPPPLSPRSACTCECAGTTRGCTATGFCNGFGNETFCDCGQTQPGVFQGGNRTYERIARYPTTGAELQEAQAPMQLEFLTMNNHTITDIAAGAAIFALSSKPCPDDADGMLCSGNGECDVETGECICKPTYLGRRCQYQCPVADEDDAKIQNLDIEDQVCSGRGTCVANETLGAAVCECEENFFGNKCHLECLKDLEGRYCSGNGTCAYDPQVDRLPYCQCRYHNTRQRVWDAAQGKLVLDEAANEAARQKCLEENPFKPGLQVRPDGYCAYHGTAGTPYMSGERRLVSNHDGYDMCWDQGLCGICESGAPASLPSAFALVAVVRALGRL